MLKGHQGRVTSVAFSPDGSYLASAESGAIVHCWNAKTYEKIATFHNVGNKLIILPKKNQLVSLHSPRIHLLHPFTHHLERKGQSLFIQHSGSIADIASDNRHSRLATANKNGIVKLWNLRTGKAEIVIRAHHQSKLETLACSPDGKRIATASQDGQIKIWDAEHGQEAYRFSRRSTAISHPRPESKLLAMNNRNEIILWSLVHGKEAGALQGHRARPFRAFFAADETLLMSCARHYDREKKKVTGELIVWDIRNGKELVAFRENVSSISLFAISENGKKLAFVGSNGEAMLGDVGRKVDLMPLKQEDPVTGIALSPDGRYLATRSKSVVVVWRAKTGERLFSLEGGQSSSYLLFSPDGRYLIVPQDDQTVALVNTESGEVAQRLEGHSQRVFGASFSSDGKRLVTSSADLTLKIWDVETGEEIFTFHLQDHPQDYVAFSRDGNRLLTSDTQFYTVWDATPPDTTQAPLPVFPEVGRSGIVID